MRCRTLGSTMFMRSMAWKSAYASCGRLVSKSRAWSGLVVMSDCVSVTKQRRIHSPSCRP